MPSCEDGVMSGGESAFDDFDSDCEGAQAGAVKARPTAGVISLSSGDAPSGNGNDRERPVLSTSCASQTAKEIATTGDDESNDNDSAASLSISGDEDQLPNSDERDGDIAYVQSQGAGRPEKEWTMVQVMSPEFANRLVLNQGGYFIKHGRQGLPHVRHVWLSGDCTKVCWQDAEQKKPVNAISFKDMTDILIGRCTAVFQRDYGGKAPAAPEDMCLSVIASDRTLDLVFGSKDERNFWYEQLLILLDDEKERRAQERRDVKSVEKELSMDGRKENWKAVLANWESKRAVTSTKSLILMGVPPNQRAVVWAKYVGNSLQVTGDLFNIFKKHAQKAMEAHDSHGKDDEFEGHEHSIKVLHKDLPRTFKEIKFFHDGGELEEPLKQVLQAYIFYRPDVGYVQGMSFIVAILLLYMEPEAAFVTFANMMNSHYFLPFFSMDMRVINARFAVFQHFLSTNCANVSVHLEKHGLQPDMYLLSWFLTLFAKSVNIDVASRMFDGYFGMGEIFVYRAAIGLLKHLNQQFGLVQMEFDECFELLTHVPQDINEEHLFSCIREIRIPRTAFAAKLAEALRANGVEE